MSSASVLSRLVRLQEALIGPAPASEKFRLITDEVQQVLDADHVGVWLVRNMNGDRSDFGSTCKPGSNVVPFDEAACLFPSACSGCVKIPNPDSLEIPLRSSSLGRVAAGETAGFAAHDPWDSRVQDTERGLFPNFGSLVCLPLRTPSGKPFGAISVCRRASLSESDVDLIRSVAAAAASVSGVFGPEAFGPEAFGPEVSDMQEEHGSEMKEAAMRAIRAATLRLEEIIEFLPDATFVINKHRRVIAWNKAIEEMTGVPKKDILGKGDYEYSVPFYGTPRPMLIDLAVANAGEVEVLYDSVIRDNDTLFSEVFTPRIGNGRGAYLWATASPLYDENGESSGAVESIRNVTARKQAERALIVSEKNYRSIFENAAEGIFQAALNGKIKNANPAMARMLGYESENELLSACAPLQTFFNDSEVWTDIVRILGTQGRVLRRDLNIIRSGGEPAWISLNAVMVTGEGEDDFLVEGIMSDVTRQRAAEVGLDRQKAMFKQLFDNSPQAVILFDRHGTVMDVNASFEHMFGFGPEEITADPLRLIPADRPGQGMEFRNKILQNEVLNEETVRMHRSGREVHVSMLGFPFRFKDRIAGGFIVYNDISKRKQYERRLTHQALHDDLTGLPNRTLFMDRLHGAVARTHRRKKTTFAVLMCDLDRFKRVNDSMGHPAGDRLLKEVAVRIANTVRSSDTVARLGGDEFAVLLEECDSPGEAVAVTRRILQEIRMPLDIDGQPVQVGASIGMVLKTADYDNPEDILRDADISMYRAKAGGRDRFKAFNRVMHEQAVRAMRMEDEIRRGIGREELYPVFQPILCAESLVPVGFEALLRWDHPERGLVMPGEIIEVAEETELIELIGAYILEDACRTMAHWRATIPGTDKLYLAVNLSARQFSQGNLVEMVEGILERTGFPAADLKLEVTETVIMHNEDVALAKLNRLKDMGVGIAVDDFGTGWSSMQALQRYPVSTLKIDRGFVGKMAGDPGSLEIVRSVVYLGRGLGVDVVAEGVEEEVQLQLLRMIGCAQVQGFLFHKPLEKDQAELLLRSSKLRDWR